MGPEPPGSDIEAVVPQRGDDGVDEWMRLDPWAFQHAQTLPVTGST